MAPRGRLVVVMSVAGVSGIAALQSCGADRIGRPGIDPVLAEQGREIFRYDTFGDEQHWPDTLRMHEVIQAAVSPRPALSVGLKVDVDALPQSVRNALAGGQIDLDDPAVTVTLLNSWGCGRYDPRINFDGLSTPIVIPPVYGLLGVARETFHRRRTGVVLECLRGRHADARPGQLQRPAPRA